MRRRDFVRWLGALGGFFALPWSGGSEEKRTRWSEIDDLCAEAGTEADRTLREVQRYGPPKGRRRIKIYVNDVLAPIPLEGGVWEACRMQDLKKGDIFRFREPGPKSPVVVHRDRTESGLRATLYINPWQGPFLATSDGYVKGGVGGAEISTEWEVVDLGGYLELRE